MEWWRRIWSIREIIVERRKKDDVFEEGAVCLPSGICRSFPRQSNVPSPRKLAVSKLQRHISYTFLRSYHYSWLVLVRSFRWAELLHISPVSPGWMRNAHAGEIESLFVPVLASRII